LFADFRGVLYVGRTENLRRRLAQHLDGSHNSWLSGAIRRPVGVMEFAWLLAGAGQQAALERYLIRAFRPLCNHAMNGN
jgi:predicted GIY-YIG superfamily endonuclease